ncbi:MAG: gamma carbonic anhydrase family protein [Promethearchaeota archaeon]
MILPNPFNGNEPVIHEKVFLAPGVTIIGDVEIGEGTNVWPGVTIRAAACRVKIGKRCSIQENCVIHSEAGTELTIGDDVLIGHGAVVHGPGDVGDNALIAIGAIKLQGRKIGEGALVGAGAVVTKDVPPFAKVMGMPAKVVGAVSREQASPNGTGAGMYYELGKTFKKNGFDQRELKET